MIRNGVVMNILLSCDDNIAKYIPPLLNSLYENNKESDLNVYIMHHRIWKNLIRTIAGFFAGKINITEIPVDPDDFELFCEVDKEHLTQFPQEAYYHFLAYRYLPEDMDRILYLDIDTICTGNIYDFYQTDFDGHFFIAADRYKKDDYYSFNSGCFVINLGLMREMIDLDFFENGITEKKAANLSFHGDQDFAGFLFRKFEDNGFVFYKDKGINFRIPWKKKIAQELEKKPNYKLIHYINKHAWEYYFDKSFENLYIGRQFGEWARYDMSFLSETVIDLYNAYWKYSEGTPFHEETKNTAVIKTQMIKKYAVQMNALQRKTYMLDLMTAAGNREAETTSGKYDAAANPDCIEITSGENYLYEFKTLFYIKNQWIILLLNETPGINSLCRIRIKCRYKTQDKIHLFLANAALETQHFPLVTENDYDETEKVKIHNCNYLCFTSDSFKRRDDHLIIEYLNVEVNACGS